MIGNFQGQDIFNYRLNPWSERQVNGAEWVTREGDIVTMGSLMMGDEIGLIKRQVTWWDARNSENTSLIVLTK